MGRRTRQNKKERPHSEALGPGPVIPVFPPLGSSRGRGRCRVLGLQSLAYAPALTSNAEYSIVNTQNLSIVVKVA